MIPRELRTERLLLRQWREDDAEQLAEIYSQPHYLEHHAALDLKRTEAQVLEFTLGWRHEGGNLRSRAVMERLGLTFRGETEWRGRQVVWYALDR